MVDGDLDLDEKAGNEVIDVTRIDSSPEEAAKLKRTFKIIMYRKNIMHIDEFMNHYVQLFKKNVALNMDPNDLKELSEQYMHRVDMYNPVYIVKSKSSTLVRELLDPSNVLFVLPAVYSHTGVVNDLGQRAVNEMQAFNNIVATDMDDRFDKKKSIYANSLATIINHMTDDNKLLNEQEIAERQAKIAVEASKSYKVGKDVTPDIQNVPEEMLEELSHAASISKPTEFKEVAEEL